MEAIRDEPLSVYHEMSFFILEKDGSYRRFDESHYQRTYEEETYKSLLKEIGFTKIETFTDFNQRNMKKMLIDYFSLLKININIKK